MNDMPVVFLLLEHFNAVVVDVDEIAFTIQLIGKHSHILHCLHALIAYLIMLGIQLSVNPFHGNLCNLVVSVHTIHTYRIEIAEVLLRPQITIARTVTSELFLQCGFLHADEFLGQLLFFLVLVPIVVHRFYILCFLLQS